MVTALLICAVGFFSAQPVPETLQQLYRQSYDCASMPAVASRPARAPLMSINDYFPIGSDEWPVLRADDPSLVEKTRAWRVAGVQPGILLPVADRKTLTDKALLGQIKTAVRAGALPIVRLGAAMPRDLRAARYIWCLYGVCPAAGYVPAGLSHDLALLPEGFYLVAPHWVGREDLPLPDRVMRLWGQKILPLHEISPPAGGVAAVLHLRGRARAFTPDVDMRWKWLGISFERNNAGLHTNILGKTLLVVGGASVRLWSTLNAWQSNILLVLSSNFGWLVLVLGLLNLLALILMIAWRRRGGEAEHVV